MGKATLQRSVTTRNDKRNDKTYLFWEYFHPDGTSVEDSEVCAEHRCTVVESTPFLSRSSTQVRMLAICGEDGFAAQDAQVRADGVTSAMHIAPPDQLDVTVTSERRDGLQLHIKTTPIDRVLVWSGSVNSQGDVLRTYWTSEDPGIGISQGTQGIEAAIPVPKARVCDEDPDCEIVVQLLKYWRGSEVPLVSSTEYRGTVSFRGPP